MCTQNMELIARNLLGIEPAVLEWDTPFKPPPAGPEEEAAMRRLNALLRDLTDATDHAGPTTWRKWRPAMASPSKTPERWKK